MAYIKFNNDPISKRTSSAFANLCSDDTVKPALNLINGAFTVFTGSAAGNSFNPFQGLNYPVDTSSVIQFEVCAGETLILFDNLTDEIPSYESTGTQNYPLGTGTEFIESVPPNTTSYYLLAADRNYVRGVLLSISYPKVDKNGDDILPADRECQLIITNRNYDSLTIPVCDVFAHFSNPETRGADGIINRIEVVNPRDSFSIKVGAMLIYTKSNSDPNDCSC
jgi:hypothetical protein